MEQFHAPPYPCCTFLFFPYVGLNTQVVPTEVYQLRQTQLETHPGKKKKFTNKYWLYLKIVVF